jgi:hypothetical protein
MPKSLNLNLAEEATRHCKSASNKQSGYHYFASVTTLILRVGYMLLGYDWGINARNLPQATSQ